MVGNQPVQVLGIAFHHNLNGALLCLIECVAPVLAQLSTPLRERYRKVEPDGVVAGVNGAETSLTNTRDILRRIGQGRVKPPLVEPAG
jgi:hypothetical protein